MIKSEKKDTANRMEMTVKGHKVTLHFMDEPNPDVAVQVKQLPLGSCLLETERSTAK